MSIIPIRTSRWWHLLFRQLHLRFHSIHTVPARCAGSVEMVTAGDVEHVEPTRFMPHAHVARCQKPYGILGELKNNEQPLP